MKSSPVDTLPMPQTPPPAATSTAGVSRRALIWFAVFMLAASTFLNYMDRQALALLSRPIQAELVMDDRAYSYVVNAFMVAYMLGNVFAGLVLDRFGPFKALTIFVGVWSLAGAAAGLADTSFQLGIARFVLGLFETGNFIAAPIIVSLLLAARHRALGVGIYTAAAMLGAAASPPLVTWIGEFVGWRQAFVIVGAAGLVWVVVWQFLPLSKLASAAAQTDEAGDTAGRLSILTWRGALKERKVWAYAMGSMLTYPVWFFYLNWFPKYLTDERGLSTLQMGSRAWVVFLCAGIGCLLAGSIIGWLVARRIAPVQARLWVLGAVCVVMPLGAVNYFEPPITVSLALSAGVALVHMIWQTTLTSLQLELFTAPSLGKVLGTAGVASGLGGIFSTWLIGHTVSIVSYKPMFVVISLVYAVALVLMMLLLRAPAGAASAPGSAR